jgi:ferredoxin
VTRWQIEVDREACIGTGMCASSAAAHFRLEGGKSTPLQESVEPDDAVLDAAESCPMEAIFVRDDQGVLLAPEL